MYRVGIVGVGDIATKVYLPLLATSPDVEIVGITSRTVERALTASRQYHLDVTCDSIDDIIAKRPDIVFVHASTTAHGELVSHFLRAGIPVYVDKPLSEDFNEVQSLAQEAEKRGLLLAVGFNRRFAPLVKEAVRYVDRPSYIVAQKHRLRSQSRPARETLFDDLIHVVDLVCWISQGNARLISGSVTTDSKGQLRIAAGMTATSDAIGQFSMARDGGADTETLSLVGNSRSAVVSELEELAKYGSGSSEIVKPGSWDSLLKRRGFVDLVDHVLASIGSPETCEASVATTIVTHEVLNLLAHKNGL